MDIEWKVHIGIKRISAPAYTSPIYPRPPCLGSLINYRYNLAFFKQTDPPIKGQQ